jgi:hypothetical protein
MSYDSYGTYKIIESFDDVEHLELYDIEEDMIGDTINDYIYKQITDDEYAERGTDKHPHFDELIQKIYELILEYETKGYNIIIYYEKDHSYKDILTMLCYVVNNFKHIYDLILKFDDFDNENLSCLYDSLKTSFLDELNLSYNKITNITSLSEALGMNTNLTKLNLSYN